MCTRIKLIVLCLGITTSAALAQIAPTPQDHLESATRALLNTAAPPDTDAGMKLERLQRDFSDLSSTTLTSSENTWRAKYATVQEDLRSLQAAAGVTDELRKQLDAFHSELELFYSSSLGRPPVGDPIARPDATRAPGTMATPVPAPAVAAPAGAQPPTPAIEPVQPVPVSPSPTVSSEEVQTMLALLDRIDRQIADARGEKDATKVVGTSGKDAGEVKVTMAAASLDEMKAEIDQLRQILQPLKRP